MLPSNQSGHSLWRKQAPHLPCSLLSHEFSLPPFFSSLNTLSVPHSVSSMGFQFHLRKLMHHGSPKPSPPQQSPVVTQPLPFLNKPSHEIHHIHAIHVAMIFMACMVGVVMLLYIVSITLRNYYSRRHNHNHSRRNTPILFDVNGDSLDDDDDADDDVERVIDHPIWYIRTAGLQQSVIDSITVFKYRKNEGLIDGTECSVCLGEFQEDESLRLLPKCSHAFHIPCIDTWLRSHKNCPLCRAPVVSDGNSSATDVSFVTVTDQRGSNVSGDETQNQETHIENFDGVAVEGSGSYHVGEFESIGNDGDDDDDSGKILPLRRSVSMDSSSTSVIFRDVVETHFGGKLNSSSKDVSVTIGKHGSGKFKRGLQKKPVSMRRSFSHNRKVLFSRHCRSQSSILPV